MNATVQPSSKPFATGSSATFRGMGALVRKDFTEWRRGRRAWVVAIVVTLVMVLTAANSWISAQIIQRLPAGADGPEAPLSMAPMDNFMAGVAVQIFILAAIFAVASLLVRERETGTLAWIAAKPISRDTIFLSKWISSSVILAVVAVIVPVIATAAAVVVLYGPIDPAPVVIVSVGAVAVVAFFAAVGLAASTFLPGQVAVVAVGFALFVLGPVIGGLFEPLAMVLPTNILGWSVGLASGADVGWITPVAWAIVTAGLILVGIRQLRRIEL
jgi:ABC-type transport system involved in multi-copper enzyme maturation permease subunit